MRDREPLALHIPEPAGRPGDAPTSAPERARRNAPARHDPEHPKLAPLAPLAA
jgi:hypothetical protein